MHFRFLPVTLAVAVALPAAFALAQGADGVAERQELMKSIGSDTRAIAGHVRGERELSAGEIAEHAGQIADAAARIPDAFGDEIHVGNAEGIETEATANIWENWPTFTAKAADLEEDARALAEVANDADDAALRASFGQMTRNCGACHDDFRQRQS